ncbi:uncharacterized protein C8Q71DRAFT_192454 [Rhodofomes roseus]|uniref:Uncharacterized protein n=1 Tax=Rhodofomes roseus TaxID=34475 RepID=A0ABQ8K7Z2_9APHY|nr:uncharacterized protein C8Q71DRAFT_192454 [Rhodofomes roseus]KAH9833164.1 hypothetical protein C8Q71DRAFT_192454 [Rhodofomes roseus]
MRFSTILAVLFAAAPALALPTDAFSRRTVDSDSSEIYARDPPRPRPGYPRPVPPPKPMPTGPPPPPPPSHGGRRTRRSLDELVDALLAREDEGDLWARDPSTSQPSPRYDNPYYTPPPPPISTSRKARLWALHAQ